MSSGKTAPSISLADFLSTVSAASEHLTAAQPSATFARSPGKIILGLIIDTLAGAAPQLADRPQAAMAAQLSPDIQSLVSSSGQWHGALVANTVAFLKLSAEEQAQESIRTLADLKAKGLITAVDHDHIVALVGTVHSAERSVGDAASLLSLQDLAALSPLGQVISNIGRDSVNSAIKLSGAIQIASHPVRADIGGAISGASSGAAVGSSFGGAVGAGIGAIIGGLIGGTAASVAVLQ